MSSKFQSGDIVWLDFDPQLGHEQSGRRPALIVWGNQSLNHIPGLSQVCAISNTDNGYPLHIALDGECGTTGFVLCEQNRVLDLDARHAEYKGHVSADVLLRVKNILKAMLD